MAATLTAVQLPQLSTRFSAFIPSTWSFMSTLQPGSRSCIEVNILPLWNIVHNVIKTDRERARERQRERDIYICIYKLISVRTSINTLTRILAGAPNITWQNDIAFDSSYCIYIYVTSLPKLVSQLSTTFASQSPFLQLAKLPLKSQAHPVSPGIA